MFLAAIGLNQGARFSNADEFASIKIIRALPSSRIELEDAHRRSSVDACEPLAAGLPLETTSYAPYITDRDRMESKRFGPVSAIRRAIFSVGLTILPSDRATLPMISRGSIVDYLDKHYVIIEVRIRRDLLDRELYFHHRPIAVTALFRGSRLSQKFEPVVTNSMRAFHSLGIYSKSQEKLQPKDLRTLVLLFKNTIAGAQSNSKEQYEFAFVRGRPSSNPDQLEIHTFVTTEQRTKLMYVNSFLPPTRPQACGILGNVVITDFDSTGLYPRDSSTRSYRIDQKASYDLAQLDQHCKSNKLEGSAFGNLDYVLDAIIDQKIAAGN